MLGMLRATPEVSAMPLPIPALYAVCLVTPSLAFLGVVKAAERFTGLKPPVEATQRSSEPVMPRRPIEQLAADLRRLDAELKVLQGAESYARHHHRSSTQLAYDDVLVDCARCLDVPVPSRPPLTQADRRAVEIGVSRAGVRW